MKNSRFGGTRPCGSNGKHVRHHTKDKGDQGVGYVISDLMRHGMHVAVPLSEHLPFDLIAINSVLLLRRLSVKYRAVARGGIELSRRSVWADKHGAHVRKHAASDYDAFAVYCPNTNCCYYVRVAEFGTATQLSLRVEPVKQRQRALNASEFTDPNRIF